MDKKGVAYNYDKRQRGTVQTVLYRNSIKEHLLYEASLSCCLALSYIHTPAAPIILPQKDTGIVDSGETHLYISPSAPHGPLNTNASKVSVVTANRQVERLSSTATLPIPQLALYFPTTGYIVPSFTNTLVGVGPICNANCTVVFTKQDVIVISPEDKSILTGWIEKEPPKLWLFSLKPTEELLMQHPPKRQKTTSAYSAYDLPSVEALVWYIHAASGFPVKST